MEQIRILHVIGSMNFGGAETLIMNLYRNIDRSKVQFDFVENTLKEAAFDEEIKMLGGKIYNCPHYTGKNHFAYLHWWKDFFQDHAQEYVAVHGHIGSTAAIYLHEAKKHGLFTIAHSHGTNGTGLKDRLYRLWSFPTRYIADQFFICSREAGEDRYGRKVCDNTEHCRLFLNAIDTAHYAYNKMLRAETRANWHITPDDIVIGHIGRFVKEKNHLFLIDVFSALYRLDPRMRLLLVGLEDPDCQVRKKAARLGLTDRIIFAGLQKDTAPFYQAMDCFVLPSLSEGLPLVMVEAQASGLPCVISDGVPDDCRIIPGLTTKCSLSNSADEWAIHIIHRLDSKRVDCSAAVAAAGFDLRQTAAWLEDLYLSKRN